MYLSKLLGSRLTDARGHSVGRLRDVVATVDGTEPPRFAALLVRRRRKDWRVPIEDVQELETHRPIIAWAHAAPATTSGRGDEVRLGHDLLDKQVIDLRNHRVVRVNDLALGRSGNGWRVDGIDVGARALLARIVPGAPHGHPKQGSLLPWSGVELLASEIANSDLAPDHQRLAQMHPADIARIADAMPVRQATEIVASLEDALAADTLEEMIDEKQADVIEGLAPERAAAILAEMAPDAAADLLAELEPENVDELLRRMGTAKAADLHALLTYPKDTAGGLMTTDYIVAPRGLSVREAIEYLRPQMRKPDWIYYIYVVANVRERTLVGVLSLRELFLADQERCIDELITHAPRQVRPDTPAATVAQIMSEYNLMALPVTSEREQLLGIVSVDDALEVILPPALKRRLPRVFS